LRPKNCCGNAAAVHLVKHSRAQILATIMKARSRQKARGIERGIEMGRSPRDARLPSRRATTGGQEARKPAGNGTLAPPFASP